jgi:hypothetical protein
MTLQPFIGSWPFLQFRNLLTLVVGLRGRVISPPQGRYLHTGQHKHRKNAHPDIHASSEIRNHDPIERAKTVRALDRASTVIDLVFIIGF